MLKKMNIRPTCKKCGFWTLEKLTKHNTYRCHIGDECPAIAREELQKQREKTSKLSDKLKKLKKNHER
jgi:hypothetical protein